MIPGVGDSAQCMAYMGMRSTAASQLASLHIHGNINVSKETGCFRKFLAALPYCLGA